jgi:hypothetical protein
MTYEEILDLEFISIDLNMKISIKEYLKKLLKTLWKEGEGFSGKRPFGNSGWQFDIVYVLIMKNLIKGQIDGNNVVEVDWKEVDSLMEKIINTL